MCQTYYDVGTGKFNKAQDAALDLARPASFPSQCTDLYLRIMNIWREGGNWMNAPVTSQYISAGDAVKRATEAQKWLSYGQYVLANEPETCR